MSYLCGQVTIEIGSIPTRVMPRRSQERGICLPRLQAAIHTDDTSCYYVTKGKWGGGGKGGNIVLLA